MIVALNQLDVQIFTTINQLMKEWNWPHSIVIAFSDQNLWGSIFAVVLVVGLIKKNKTIIAFFMTSFIAAGISDYLAYQWLKPAFSRERPCYALLDVVVYQSSCGSQYGFPSNHATNALAIFVVFIFFVKRSFYRFIATLIVLLVCLSRVFIGVHYLGDVIGGAILGAASAGIVLVLTGKLRNLYLQSTS